MAVEDTVEFETAREALTALLRVWRSELTALAREVLPQRMFALASETIVEVTPSELIVVDSADGVRCALGSVATQDHDAATALARIVSEGSETMGRDVVLQLDDSLVLRPTVRLPNAPSRLLRGALGFELERLTPLPPDQLYFDYLMRPRDKRSTQSDIDLRIVRRQVLDAAVSVCRSAGLSVASVAIAGDRAKADWRHFPVDRGAFLQAQWRHWRNHALGALAILLLLAVLVAGYWRAESANAALDDQVADAMQHAAVVERMQHHLETAQSQFALLVQHRQARRFVETFAALTRTLPDDTWLTEFSIEGGKIRTSGYSKNASALIGLIDNSGTFANAQFGAPLVRNPADGTDRFDLQFDVAGGRTP